MAFLLVPVAIVCLVIVIKPQLTWQVNRWQYRDPDALEPSEAALAVRRIGAGLLLVVCVVVLVLSVRDSIQEGRLPEDTAMATEGFETTEDGHDVVRLAQVEREEYGILGYHAGDDGETTLVLSVPPCFGDPEVETEEGLGSDTLNLDVGVRRVDGGGDCASGDEVVTHDLGRHGPDEPALITSDGGRVDPCPDPRCGS